MNLEAKHGATCILYGVLLAIIGLFAAIILLLVWPYNLVSFTGEAKVLGSHTVEPGSTLMLEWSSFCVDSEDLYYERWADVYSDESEDTDELLFSYAIPTFIAYHDTNTCQAPAVGPITLPNYLPPGLYRIRFSVSYHPNLLRTITVSTQTEQFRIVPTADGATAPPPPNK